ncbi:MAG: hypothetical protein ACK6EB_48080 [Planctomyces sp.]
MLRYWCERQTPDHKSELRRIAGWNTSVEMWRAFAAGMSESAVLCSCAGLLCDRAISGFDGCVTMCSGWRESVRGEWRLRGIQAGLLRDRTGAAQLVPDGLQAEPKSGLRAIKRGL